MTAAQCWAVVGAGNMGARVSKAAAALDGVDVAAVVDADSRRAQQVAQPLGAPTVATLDELIETGDIDAAYVGIPHAAHRAAVTRLLDAGIAVLLDKPLATTAADADAVARSARVGTPLMLGFSYRFRREWQRTAEVLHSGKLGRVRAVSEVIVESAAATPGWYWSQEAGGGVIHLQAHHVFDRLAWLLGEPLARISATADPAEPDRAESAVALWATTASGTAISVTLGFATRVEAHGEARTAILADGGTLVLDSLDRSLRVAGTGGSAEERHEDQDWLGDELAAFQAVVAGPRQDTPALPEGRYALDCALAAHRSLASGGAPCALETEE